MRRPFSVLDGPGAQLVTRSTILLPISRNVSTPSTASDVACCATSFATRVAREIADVPAAAVSRAVPVATVSAVLLGGAVTFALVTAACLAAACAEDVALRLVVATAALLPAFERFATRLAAFAEPRRRTEVFEPAADAERFERPRVTPVRFFFDVLRADFLRDFFARVGMATSPRNRW